MLLFRLFLIVSWLIVLGISINAFSSEGFIVGEVFMTDIMTGLWRSQFNSDFLVHLILVGLWASWRQRFSATSLFIGALCILGGGLFSLAYVLYLSAIHKGNIVGLLLGKRYDVTAEMSY